jgi:hypothetical protein
MVHTLTSKQDTYNRILFFYIMVDFLITYLGVSYGCIEEANPFMKWLFKLPFIWAAVIRLSIGAAIYYIYRFIQKNADISYRRAILFALTVENYVLLLHLRWMVAFIGEPALM